MDINNLCFRIVLDYNRRPGFGKQGKTKDMKTVIARDGSNVAYQVADIALYYFRTKYPDSFFEPLKAFTGMKKKTLQEYITGRDAVNQLSKALVVIF